MINLTKYSKSLYNSTDFLSRLLQRLFYLQVFVWFLVIFLGFLSTFFYPKAREMLVGLFFGGVVVLVSSLIVRAIVKHSPKNIAAKHFFALMIIIKIISWTVISFLTVVFIANNQQNMILLGYVIGFGAVYSAYFLTFLWNFEG